MDSTTLRWVLIVIGLLILGLIFVFGNPERKRGPRASRRSTDAADKRAKRGAKARREPTIGPDDDGDDTAPAEDSTGVDQGELAIDEAPGRREPVIGEPTQPRRPPMPEPDRILSLFLLARDNHVITGAQLLEAAVKTGMDFGDMNIFHRTTEGDSRPVFSLANAAKPGHFDRSAWHEFETGALVVFTTLPNPMPALDAWDAMLATARRMAEVLNAELHDDKHHPFTRQREAQIREEMRDYDRKRVVTRN